jgi:hypothetical protein
LAVQPYPNFFSLKDTPYAAPQTHREPDPHEFSAHQPRDSAGSVSSLLYPATDPLVLVRLLRDDS